MKKKLARLLAICSLLVGSLTFTAAPVAAIQAPIATPTVVNCQTQGQQYFHNGKSLNPNTFATVRGVRAKIYKDFNIGRCTEWTFDTKGGASYWVSLEPAPGNPYYGSSSAILQVGVVWCNQEDLFSDFDPCDDGGEVTPQLFWADGGCNNDTPIAQPLLSAQYNAAPAGGLWFFIDYLGGGDYVIEVENDDGTFHVTKPVNDSTHISCWATQANTTHPVRAGFFCERWDLADACGGNTSGGHVAFRGVRVRKSVGGAYYMPGEQNVGQSFLATGFTTTASDDHGVNMFQDGFDLYTTN